MADKKGRCQVDEKKKHSSGNVAQPSAQRTFSLKDFIMEEIQKENSKILFYNIQECMEQDQLTILL